MPYKHGSANACFLSDCTERMHLENVLKMCPVRFSTCLGTFYHGKQKTFKDPGIAVESLTGVHNELLECLHVVNTR
jgi:hypothetical protein